MIKFLDIKSINNRFREKGYAAAYKDGKRPVTLIGINFSSAKRNIDEPIFEKFDASKSKE